MNWDTVARQVVPYIFKIETPTGHGTGFLCSFNSILNAVGIATAYHVIEHSDKWDQPIRLILNSGESLLLKKPDFSIFSNPDIDSAMILVQQSSLQLANIHLPGELLDLIPSTEPLPIGCEIAWLGYPGIAPSKLCFFSGAISAWLDFRNAYLVDGITINGVSGGPVMYKDSDASFQIVGFVTAYIPNREIGETSPGLSVVQDVSYFSRTIATMRSIEDGLRSRSIQPEGTVTTAPCSETISVPSVVPDHRR